ncbi:MAG: hypothetical protein IT464_11660 [Planctomycetes bacterium]|nr:hypothetical protein [Planctomycetota bacterium]
MQITEFKAIVKTFADPGTELLFDRESFGIAVNGDVINAKITAISGDVYVNEGSGAEPASKWILKRLAKLPLLASRLRDSISQTPNFVSPGVSYLPTLEQRQVDRPEPSEDGLQLTLTALNQRSPLETTVLYITSDAGEGKTTLINELARTQAQRFIEAEADWLLVPIPLGGRHFLRFDDITVGVMQNRYRFPFLYFNSFLALVRMGVIVPAFDGFEEMFVESSSGEALSAMGILVGSLNSQGAVLIAARKAYFEFENLRAQERLFDTIKGYSVGFAKLELHRWAKRQFVNYCINRGIREADELHRRVSERLTPDHALLTRAVLVRRLVDVAVESPTLDGFLTQLQRSGSDFFSVFVRGLVEREAHEKWLYSDQANELRTPLLSVDEHCELLSLVALSMWESKVDFCKRDVLEFTADFYCETARKGAVQAQQVRERIRGHAMLVPSANAADALEFDHDEFRLFFLGEAIARQIRPMTDIAKAEVLGTLRRGPLPADAMQALFRALTRDAALDRLGAVKFLLAVAAMDAQASFTHENVAALLIRLVSGIDGGGLTVSGFAFGHDALLDKRLGGLEFHKSYFAPTSLDNAQVRNCTFKSCRFAELRMTDTSHFEKTVFSDCNVDSLKPKGRDRDIFDPAEIRQHLEGSGVTFTTSVPTPPLQKGKEPDFELVCVEKLVRYFMRSTHMSESVIRMKLSDHGQQFIDETLPRLLDHGVLEEIANRGGGHQRRFRLGVTLKEVNDAMESAKGDFEKFLSQFS